MGLKEQVGKYRTSLSMEEVRELVTSIDLAYPQGLSSNQLCLYNVYRKLKSQLVLYGEGLINPDYITKPKPTLIDRLDFDNNPVPVMRKIRTPEELQKEIDDFEKERPEFMEEMMRIQLENEQKGIV